MPSTQPKTLFTRTFRSLSALLSCFIFSGVALAAPSITLSQTKGPPTTKVLVSGNSWGQNAVVNIYFDAVQESSVVTDATGSFSNAAILAPKQAKPGNHSVTAVENDNGDKSQQTFLVQTDWSQAHFSPDHSGLNPYENVVSKSNVANLKLKWKYTTGLYVVDAPAVVDGSVFFGSDDGNVYALDANSGLLRWKFTTDGYVDSSPAVAYGLVYVGSEDHTIYALDPKTGNLKDQFNGGAGYSDGTVDDGYLFVTSQFIWSFSQSLQWDWRSVRAATTSPATANGMVYVGGAGSAGSTLTALLFSGQGGWNYDGSGPATSGPSLAEGLVYFGLNHDLYALNAGDGAVLWTFFTLANVGAPAVANEIVYVGSGSDLDALDARTGRFLWGYTDPNGYTVESVAIANGVVYFGTDGGGNAYGTVTAVDASTGALLWQYVADGAVFSSPVIANGVLYFGTHGGSMFAFSLNGQ